MPSTWTLSTIIRKKVRMARKKVIAPVHPGEILKEDFLKPLNLSVNRLSMDLRVPVTRMNDIVRGKRSITADTALRLAKYFGTTAQVWINLQSSYDLQKAEDAAGQRIEREVRSRETAA